MTIYHEGVQGGTTHGGIWTYHYADPERDHLGIPQANSQTNITAPDGGITKVHYQVTEYPGPGGVIRRVVDPMPDWVEDPLGRRATFQYAPAWKLKKQTNPDGDFVEYTHDLRGNVTAYRKQAKLGSGISDITMSAVFSSSCENFKTCNKPMSVTDERGNVTDYTYDPSHGGVLTETGPAVSGVRPQKRFTYGQRHAWLKNSSGGYSQAASPIWLLVRESSCKAGTASGNGCASGVADEVVTEYDYGPDAGPNNLWLRGKVVTADGVSLRTCYSYDEMGNKISETEPRAGLTSCP